MPRQLSVVASVRRDLAGLNETARTSGLAASALSLAALLDGASMLTARDAASVAAELRQTLSELRKQYPAVRQREDKVDEISARRAARRATAPG